MDDNDIPVGYSFKPTDEELIESVVLLNDGKPINPDRVARTDLFDRHPAVIIRNLNLQPYMRDKRNYYLFYCKIPDHTIYDRLGYHRIVDQTKGVWEDTNYSSIISCDLSDKTTRLGEIQTFRYKTLDQISSSWRMVMYGLPDDQSKMVICKVFEKADSETAEAVRSVANMDRELEETINMTAAQAAKVELLEAALQEERTKHDKFRLDIRTKTQLLAKKVRERNYAERKEADGIEPPNKKRRTRRVRRNIWPHAELDVPAERAARNYL